MTKRPKVKKQLRNLHPEADHLYTELEGSRPDKYGFLRCGDGGRPYAGFRVMPEQLRRTVPLADGLFRAAEGLGDDSGVERDREKRLFLKLLGERVEFGLWQGLRRTPHVPMPKEKETEARKRQLSLKVDRDVAAALYAVPTFDYLPSPEFTLQLQPLRQNGTCVRRTWKDAPDKPLELQLGEIALGLAKYAAKARELRLERAARERERAAQEARQAELKRQQAAEQARRSQLERDAEAWHRAELVRRYVAAVETEAPSGQGAIDPESELGRWLAWARQHADRIDPGLQVLALKLSGGGETVQ